MCGSSSRSTAASPPLEEAALCRELGIDLMHHRPPRVQGRAAGLPAPLSTRTGRDATYPHQGLSGVGVAFKLACAICGEPRGHALARYCDLVCLGTDRRRDAPAGARTAALSATGLQALQKPRRARPARPSSEECGLRQSGRSLPATVGYILAPRINAAGRMGRVELAVELFLTEQPAHAAQLAQGVMST